MLAAVGAGTLEGVTNTEVLQEILHVRSRRVDMSDATSAVRAAAGIVADVLPVTRENVLDACTILDAHPMLGARDALHAAVMQRARMNLLVSLDRDFDSLNRLKRLDPADALGLVR